MFDMSLLVGLHVDVPLESLHRYGRLDLDGLHREERGGKGREYESLKYFFCSKQMNKESMKDAPPPSSASPSPHILRVLQGEELPHQ